MNILIFLVILLILVLVHEFGHFFSAKRFGIRVDEFGFGFPPRLFGIKFGETEYTWNLFPLGGFVKIFGENPDAFNLGEERRGDYERSFISKAKWKQAIVLFAGVFMNFVLAWILFSSGLMSGLPASVGSSIPDHELEDVNLVIISVSPELPASKAGLRPGDSIVSVGSLSERVSGQDEYLEDINPQNLRAFIATHPSQEIEIGYVRGAERKVNFVKVVPVLSVVDGTPIIGIGMDQVGIAKLPFFRAFWEGMKITLSVTKDTIMGLYTLIIESLRGQGSLASITGPVGMVGIVGEAYEFGLAYLLSFAAIISLNLAIINLLPFPALDGGRLLFLLIEKIKGSALNPKFANTANLVGFIALIILMLLVTYNDIVKLL